eukprot:1156257-Pelagomonas_calceolata.AAC.13
MIQLYLGVLHAGCLAHWYAPSLSRRKDPSAHHTAESANKDGEGKPSMLTSLKASAGYRHDVDAQAVWGWARALVVHP